MQQQQQQQQNRNFLLISGCDNDKHQDVTERFDNHKNHREGRNNGRQQASTERYDNHDNHHESSGMRLVARAANRQFGRPQQQQQPNVAAAGVAAAGVAAAGRAAAGRAAAGGGGGGGQHVGALRGRRGGQAGRGGGRGGRGGGGAAPCRPVAGTCGPAFRADELNSMLDSIASRLPIGGEEWKEVAKEHNKNFPDKERTSLSLRRKFTLLCKSRIKTGDPAMPPEVRRAKALFYKIEHCADATPELQESELGFEAAGEDDELEEESVVPAPDAASLVPNDENRPARQGVAKQAHQAPRPMVVARATRTNTQALHQLGVDNAVNLLGSHMLQRSLQREDRSLQEAMQQHSNSFQQTMQQQTSLIANSFQQMQQQMQQQQQQQSSMINNVLMMTMMLSMMGNNHTRAGNTMMNHPLMANIMRAMQIDTNTAATENAEVVNVSTTNKESKTNEGDEHNGDIDE